MGWMPRGWMSALKEDARVNSEPFETLPEKRGVGQDTSDGAMLDKYLHPSPRRIIGVHGFALLLTLALFYFHVVVIFDVISKILRCRAWLLENLEPKDAGKLFLLGCFFAFTVEHVVEAVVWGLFLRWTKAGGGVSM